jgi:hypothetical protein
MVSRQVQNESSGWPWRSAMPAIARWNACECRLGIAGRAQPRALRVTMGAVGICMAPLWRKHATPCGRLRAHGGRMDPMLVVGAMFAVVALLMLVFASRRQRRGADGDGGGSVASGSGGSTCDNGSDGGGCGGGGGGD